METQGEEVGLGMEAEVEDVGMKGEVDEMEMWEKVVCGNIDI